MEDFVVTRGSKARRDAIENFVSVHYETPKKKFELEKKPNVTQTNVQQSKKQNLDKADLKRQQELEMKRVRYEVIKFGMTGFEKVKAREAKVALATSLGAKPERKKGLNYKELQCIRKKEKEEAKTEEPVSGLNKSLLKYKPKKMRKKPSDGILGIYGKVKTGTSARKKN